MKHQFLSSIYPPVKRQTSHLMCFVLSMTLVSNYLAVNIGLHTIAEVLIYALPAFLIPFVSLLCLIWVLEKVFQKSPKVASSILMFATLGAVVEPHRQTNPEMPLILFWSYVIPLLLLVTTIGWFFGRKVFKPLLVFLLAFGGERTYQMSLKIYERWQKQSYIESESYRQESASYFQKKSGEKPFVQKLNVYHILVDSYPSLEGLKRFGGNNEGFYQKLESKGFRAYRHAFSNYSNTHETLISMWEMRHLHEGSNQDFDPYAMYGRNKSFKRFIQEGYQIYCDYPCYAHTESPSQPVSKKIKSHLFLRNDRLLQYYMLYYLGPVTSQIIGTSEKPNNSLAREWIMLKDHVQNPAFVYLHDLSHQVHHQKSREKINTALLNIIEDISQNPNPSLIILNSDHGNRKEWVSESSRKETALDNFGVLLAVRWPAMCESFNTVPKITPVNLYRYVFACLEGSDIPKNLEPDHSYMKGQTLLEALNIGKDVYLHIQNHVPLQQPVKIGSSEN